MYEPNKAHAMARRRFLDRCHRKLSVTGLVETQVIKLLQRGWSPQLIAGRIGLETRKKLSHMTIYRFTKKNAYLKRYLHHKGRRYPYRPTSTNQGPKPKWWRSVHERPLACQERSELGHWERDLMYAKDRAPILVCTDRKSRYVTCLELNTSGSQETQEKTAILLKPFPVHSVTNDQGSEFKSRNPMGCPVYFCDPRAPNQRGTVENTIGVMRRFIKNSTDLSEVNLEQIEIWMNLRPRKVLDYKTPYEVMFEESVALVV